MTVCTYDRCRSRRSASILKQAGWRTGWSCCQALWVVSLCWASGPQAQAQEPAHEAPPRIERVLPPEGLEIPAEQRAGWEAKLQAARQRLRTVEAGLAADVEVLLKAVELAIEHREFYTPRDFAKADWALSLAEERLTSLERGQSPWRTERGLVVGGYRSSIDGSVQPLGLVIPEGLDLSRPVPLYVWLHGRGDRNTDLHFLQERATRAGQITPAGAIVLHPFGRHCVGYKHAGEIDVLEAVAAVAQRYPIDPNRIVLIGFSMGGAGAWHLGAHYADRWVAVAPGAGFAETARYQRLTPDRYPPWYEQTLWGQYDVPLYVRNLFNTTVIAYSGELDRQIQAARVMEEAFANQGRQLVHLIGPGVEHRYEPMTLQELLRRLDQAVAQGRNPDPDVVYLQTRTLRYGRQFWVQALGLKEHWKDSRIDAVRKGDTIQVQTQNVTALALALAERPWTLRLDGQMLSVSPQPPPASAPGGAEASPGVAAASTAAGRDLPQRRWRYFVRKLGQWELVPDDPTAKGLLKAPGLQGPIDDALMGRVLVVAPSGRSPNPRFQAWVDAELAHFRQRWRALMRGELPLKLDRDVTEEDLQPGTHLVLWGDPHSNQLLARLSSQLPVRYDAQRWSLGGVSYDGDRFAPVLVYPRRDAAGRRLGYLVLNSGLTFREGHDRTNSLQNPKLPDWAIVDLSQPPDALAPGRIHDADFFDEHWRLKRPPQKP